MSYKQIILFFLVFSFYSFSYANVKLDFTSTIPNQDNLDINSSPTGSLSLYDAAIKVQMGADSKTYLTVGYLMINKLAPLNATATYTLTSNNPYIGLEYFMLHGLFSIGANYSNYVQATYSQSGTTNESWTGSAYYLKTALHPKLSDNFKINLAVSYYVGAYNAKSGSPPVSTVNNFNQTLLLPTIGFEITF